MGKTLYIGDEKAIEGQEVTMSDGEKGILKGWAEPHKPSSTGRVYVELEGSDWDHQFFPGVIGGVFIEVGND